MLRIVQSFLSKDSGSLPVDWIVLSAGVVAFALGAGSLVMAGTDAPSGQLDMAVAKNVPGK